MGQEHRLPNGDREEECKECECTRLKRHIRTLMCDITRYKRALAFYANEDNYSISEGKWPGAYNTAMLRDRGEMARDALRY